MAFAVNDRVKETSTTTGTGTLSLAGALTGFQTFVTGIGNSNTTYYAIVHESADEFEVGIGTVTDASPDTLSRTTILESSNSDSAVNFSSGTKTVFCTLPAEKALLVPGSGDLTIDAPADIILDADGADVLLKDAGTQYAALTNSSGNLILKSGSTTAITFDGANATFAGTVTIGSAGISEAELEILDGATVTTDELNVLDGITSTVAELNIVDGNTSASSVTVADADRVVLNDAGTMKQVAVTDLSAYFDDEITAMPNLVTTAATTVGALDSGSITSNFGTINNGASTITTTGAITGGSLVADDVTVNGKAITMTGSSSDTATLTVGTNGTLDIVTTDDAAAAANIQITADGTAELAGTTVTLDSSGGITLDADGGTITFADAGSSLGTITSSGYSGTAAVATTVTVSDSTANTNFPVVFHDESNALLDDTGALRYNPSTGELLVPKLTVSGTTTTVDTVTMNAENAIIFEGATADAHETTLTIVDPTADRTINLPNQSGTIPVLAAASNTAITSTPAELNILDGATVVVGEINALDLGSTAVGTAIASKAVILDSNKDYTGIRNFTVTGELDAATGDFSSDVDIDGDLLVGDDITLDSDAAVLGFGADKDVTLTHVADTGLLLNSTMAIQFNDASQFINAPSATVLDINATDEIELNATLADVNANLDVSGTYTGGGLMTTGGNIVIPDAGNIGSASDTDAISIGADGDVTLTQDLELAHDGATLSFGADSEVVVTHVADSGLTLKHTATADDKPINLVLATGETDMAANDVLGKISFQAPDEGAGTDAILVSGAVQARAEGDFSSSSNATSLDFMTGASEAATTKMTLTSAGALGIGTTAPSNASLDVAGRGRFLQDAAATTGAIILRESSGGVGGHIQFVTNDNSGQRGFIGVDSSSTMNLGGVAVTATSTPAFLARPSTAQNNFAADNSVVAIAFGTEVFDQGGNFASNTFTAPVTGKYQFNVIIYFTQIDSGASYYQLRLDTSNRSHFGVLDFSSTDSDLAFQTISISMLTDMDANDTAAVNIQQNAGTAQTDVSTDSSFGGFLVC